MSIPLNDRIEQITSSLGVEDNPQSFLLKDNFWTLQLCNGKILLKVFEGSFFILKDIVAKEFFSTYALDDNKVVTSNSFWLWIIDFNNNLSLYEYEPFYDSEPVLLYSKTNILLDIKSFCVSVVTNDKVRLSVLFNNSEYNSVVFDNIKSIESPVVYSLDWPSSRSNEFSNLIHENKTQLDIAYLDRSSPFNVYIESFSINTPTGFTISRVGMTNEILLVWNSVPNVDLHELVYLIERDTDPLFSAPVSFYAPYSSSFETTYSDSVYSPATYYYRLRTLDNSIMLESLFTSAQSITLHGVVYNGNGSTGGVVPVDTLLYEQSDIVTVFNNIGNLTKENCIFLYWNTKSDGSGITYRAGEEFTIVDSNITLYVLWAECYVGGLIGVLTGSGNDVVNSYWDEENSEISSSSGGIGKSSNEMKIKGTQDVYTTWDFDNLWYMNEHEE